MLKPMQKLKMLTRKRTLADIEILLQKTGTTVQGNVFAEIGGNTLVNEDRTVDSSIQCQTYNTPLTRMIVDIAYSTLHTQYWDSLRFCQCIHGHGRLI